MEWPEELLDIFEDPLFADVKVKESAPTAMDLLQRKMAEITEWMNSHSGKEPSLESGADITEKCLAASLYAIRKDSCCHAGLQAVDKYGLLQE
jgi:hypothetical protein